MPGRLITIEGTDGSGKSTQFDLLCARLEAENIPFRMQRFPRYDRPSSALLRQYLDGAYGEDPAAVNPYAASSFFAADRFAAFSEDLGEFYRGGGLILCDRYTPSNAIHQASKLPEAEEIPFCDWLFDYEYTRLKLPAPDLVLFLDMPEAVALQLIRARADATGAKTDIHEQNAEYLRRCRGSALRLTEHYGFVRIPCAEDGAPKSKAAIANAIWSSVEAILPAEAI